VQWFRSEVRISEELFRRLHYAFQHRSSAKIVGVVVWWTSGWRNDFAMRVGRNRTKGGFQRCKSRPMVALAMPGNGILHFANITSVRACWVCRSGSECLVVGCSKIVRGAAPRLACDGRDQVKGDIGVKVVVPSVSPTQLRSFPRHTCRSRLSSLQLPLAL